jgi:uncharacterized membrane protein
VEALAPLLIIVVLALVVWLVGAPLRRGHTAEDPVEVERAALEAARDAKYAEIRELELDHRTGKLTDEDFRALDRQLRGEAVEILRKLDALH